MYTDPYDEDELTMREMMLLISAQMLQISKALNEEVKNLEKVNESMDKYRFNPN